MSAVTNNELLVPVVIYHFLVNHAANVFDLLTFSTLLNIFNEKHGYKFILVITCRLQTIVKHNPKNIKTNNELYEAEYYRKCLQKSKAYSFMRTTRLYDHNKLTLQSNMQCILIFGLSHLPLFCKFSFRLIIQLFLDRSLDGF